MRAGTASLNYDNGNVFNFLLRIGYNPQHVEAMRLARFILCTIGFAVVLAALGSFLWIQGPSTIPLRNLLNDEESMRGQNMTLPEWLPRNITVRMPTARDTTDKTAKSHSSLPEATKTAGVPLASLDSLTFKEVFLQYPHLLKRLDEVRNYHALTQTTKLAISAVETQLSTVAQKVLFDKHRQEALDEEKQMRMQKLEQAEERVAKLSKEMRSRFSKTSQLAHLGGVVRSVSEAVAEARETFKNAGIGSGSSRFPKESYSSSNQKKDSSMRLMMHESSLADTDTKSEHDQKEVIKGTVIVNAVPDVLYRVTKLSYDPDSPAPSKQVRLIDENENEFTMVRPGPGSIKKVSGSSIDTRLLEDLTAVLATVFSGSVLSAATGLQPLPAQLIAGAAGNWLGSMEHRILSASKPSQADNSTNARAPLKSDKRIPAGHIRLARWFSGLFYVHQSVQIQTLAMLAALFLLFTESLRLGDIPWEKATDDVDDVDDSGHDVELFGMHFSKVSETENEKRKSDERALDQTSEVKGHHDIQRQKRSLKSVQKEIAPVVSKRRIVILSLMHPILVFLSLFCVIFVIISFPKIQKEAQASLLLNPYLYSKTEASRNRQVSGGNSETHKFMGCDVPNDWLSLLFTACIASLLCTLTSLDIDFSNEVEVTVSDVVHEHQNALSNEGSDHIYNQREYKGTIDDSQTPEPSQDTKEQVQIMIEEDHCIQSTHARQKY